MGAVGFDLPVDFALFKIENSLGNYARLKQKEEDMFSENQKKNTKRVRKEEECKEQKEKRDRNTVFLVWVSFFL